MFYQNRPKVPIRKNYNSSQPSWSERNPNWAKSFKTIFALAIIPFIFTYKFLSIILKPFSKIEALFWFRWGFLFLVLLVSWAFLNLQFFNYIQSPANVYAFANREIIPAKRGEIYIKDYSQNSSVKITDSQLYITIFLDPKGLNQILARQTFSKEELFTNLAQNLNISYHKIESFINSELNKNSLSSFAILEKQASAKQKYTIDQMRRDPSPEIRIFAYHHWLGYEDLSLRNYPYGDFMSSVLGYVRNTPALQSEVLNIPGCREMVVQNEARGTVKSLTGLPENGIYTMGVYGLEQKYCSELAGLNGGVEHQVVDGADLYLTIDRNLQMQAEQLLANLIKENTNSVGAPKDGTIIVVNSKTGAILAMASTPSGDPNHYYNYPNGFLNVATSVDYESGSVIKPLTVAMVMNEYLQNYTNNDGKRAGISQDWIFNDYNWQGKPYKSNTGNVYYIKNAEGRSFAGSPLSIEDCLKHSINTCLATMQETVSNFKTKEYFEEKFLFGKPTLAGFMADTNGYTKSFETDIDFNFSYGSFSFGQGFRSSALQIVRAYTILANDGKLTEPYLVDTLKYQGKEIINQDSDLNGIIKQPPSIQIISQEVAQNITKYLTNTVNDGYKTEDRGRVDGYDVAAKSGTAQVSRPDSMREGLCLQGESIQGCNTRLGLYDHTFVGYGPSKDPEYIVLVKLSEPNPGVVRNYSVNTLGGAFSKMMKYTLQYYGVPRDY